jgi:hypothetical protein
MDAKQCDVIFAKPFLSLRSLITNAVIELAFLSLRMSCAQPNRPGRERKMMKEYIWYFAKSNKPTLDPEQRKKMGEREVNNQLEIKLMAERREDIAKGY